MNMKRSIDETRKLIEAALADMVKNGDKVNVSTVARRIGINHSYIHNDFPDLKLKIDNAKIIQRAERNKISDSKVIERQKKQISSLKYKTRNADSHSADASLEAIYIKMMEVYRLHDSVRKENEDIKNRLMHGLDGVFPETGELIKLDEALFLNPIRPKS
ncbi:hypothetical protein C3Y05_011310 [Aeromonas allosaccharophila]|uniref:hypothetical protein n=1 Tax=Aeromonas allosaccharophila TaxID=656 RepID=UPI0013CB96E4|nr:hypothetical protein [Aeromonas allosaccharophila]WDO00281.1 hypothetical protein C3Y05_011310 [Aeromonas allosaccharophila]